MRSPSIVGVPRAGVLRLFADRIRLLPLHFARLGVEARERLDAVVVEREKVNLASDRDGAGMALADLGRPELLRPVGAPVCGDGFLADVVAARPSHFGQSSAPALREARRRRG